MFLKFCSALILSIFFTSSIYAQIEDLEIQGRDIKPVEQTINKIYTPMAFDTNDTPHFFVETTLNNTCELKVPPKVLKIDHKKREIYISVQKKVIESSLCMMITKDFADPVYPQEKLSQGTYKILNRVEKNDGSFVVEQKAELNISKATTKSVDAALYAPIQEVRIERNSPKSTSPEALDDLLEKNITISLVGEFPTPCFSIANISVKETQPGLIEVIPFAEEKKGICMQKVQPFDAKIPLSSIKAGHYLLYVRSANDTFFHRLIDLN